MVLAYFPTALNKSLILTTSTWSFFSASQRKGLAALFICSRWMDRSDPSQTGWPRPVGTTPPWFSKPDISSRPEGFPQLKPGSGAKASVQADLVQHVLNPSTPRSLMATIPTAALAPATCSWRPGPSAQAADRRGEVQVVDRRVLDQGRVPRRIHPVVMARSPLCQLRMSTSLADQNDDELGARTGAGSSKPGGIRRLACRGRPFDREDHRHPVAAAPGG